MPDKFSKTVRSKIMSSIRSKDTQPELAVRKLLWANGKRYRIHDSTVFGTPDISNKSKKVAIFIDGCFWHGCEICYTEPKTNVKFWKNKILQNKKRRETVRLKLKKDGFKILVFMEHEIRRNPLKVSQKISLVM